MNENDKIDDLFRANSDYLADQPHRDFDREAFWQQLRPELAQPKRKIAGWWWASAAVVLLALLAGGVWWAQSERMESEKVIAKKPAEILPEQKVQTAQLSEPVLRLEEKLPENQVVIKKTTIKVIPKSEKKTKASEPSVGTSLTLAPVSTAYKAIVVNTSIPEPNEDKPVRETTSTKPDKPRYRIVHLNEIQPQKEQKSQNRPQVALRIGVTGASAPRTVEPHISLAIPINN